MEPVNCQRKQSMQRDQIQLELFLIPTLICMHEKLQTALWIHSQQIGFPINCHNLEVKNHFFLNGNFQENSISLFQGFDQSSSNGNSNAPPSSRPTQSTFPSTDNTRPGSTPFSPASTSGSYPTDSGSSQGDFSTTPFVASSSLDPNSNSRPTSQPPDDLYTIKNTFPATYPTTNRNPQTNNQPDTPPTRPTDTNRPQTPTNSNKNPPQIPINTYQPDHHPYPVGPDPFPGYFPHPHPHYHYNLDHDDDHFPGHYAHNAPSLHPDRYYPHPPPSHIDHYGSGGLYAAGRYPDSDIHIGSGWNRKTGYQVSDNSPDVPMVKGEFEIQTIITQFQPEKRSEIPQTYSKA
jgi:hypothetical protein